MYSQLYVSKYDLSSLFAKHWLCVFAISRVHSLTPSSNVGLHLLSVLPMIRKIARFQAAQAAM